MATELSPAATLEMLARVAKEVGASVEQLKRIEAMGELIAQTQFGAKTEIMLLVQAQRGTHDAIDRLEAAQERTEAALQRTEAALHGLAQRQDHSGQLLDALLKAQARTEESLRLLVDTLRHRGANGSEA